MRDLPRPRSPRTPVGIWVRVWWTSRRSHASAGNPRAHLADPAHPDFTVCGVLIPAPVRGWVWDAVPVNGKPRTSGQDADSAGDCSRCSRQSWKAQPSVVRPTQWHALTGVITPVDPT